MDGKENTLILIVDDDPRNLQFIGNVLAENGFEPAVAFDGDQTFEFLKRLTPELILLDVMMPGMDGFEVCRKLKGDSRTRGVPIIFLTAKSRIEDMVCGFEAGAVDYVTKPFNTRELLTRIRTHIELKRAREEIETLRGHIPICSRCKKIRNDKGYWKKIEEYIEKHSEALLLSGMCPDCSKELYGDRLWHINMGKRTW